MKYLLLFCFLFCGCARLEFELVDKRTPEITEPIQNEYKIRTRIVVKKNEVGLVTENLSQIINEFYCAEKIYKPINVKFIIVKCDFTDGMSLPDCYKDANKYPNMMSVYFLDNTREFQGESSFPFTKSEKFGIVMMKTRISERALAHEIGHYFGLIHTFEKDYCDDTIEELLIGAACTGKSANCGNVMNYCFHEGKQATPNQCNRFLSFLINSRKDHILSETEFPINLSDSFRPFIEPPFKEYYTESLLRNN